MGSRVSNLMAVFLNVAVVSEEVVEDDASIVIRGGNLRGVEGVLITLRAGVHLPN